MAPAKCFGYNHVVSGSARRFEMTQAFSFAAVMSVATGRNLVVNLNDYYNLVNHLTTAKTGEEVESFTNYRARKALFKQLPALNDEASREEAHKLAGMLDLTTYGQEHPHELITGWLVQQAARLGLDMTEPIMVESAEEQGN